MKTQVHALLHRDTAKSKVLATSAHKEIVKSEEVIPMDDDDLNEF